MKEFQKAIEQASGSYTDILEGQILAHYIMLENVFGTREKIAESKRTDLCNYKYVKKGYLKLIYTCVLHSPDYENGERLASAVLDEMIQTVDKSQLTFSEIKTIPSDYIRQVCGLETPEPAQEEVYDEEEERLKLVRIYAEHQRKRFGQQMRL